MVVVGVVVVGVGAKGLCLENGAEGRDVVETEEATELCDCVLPWRDMAVRRRVRIGEEVVECRSSSIAARDCLLG